MKEFSISGFFNTIIEADSEEEAIKEFETMVVSSMDKVDIEEIDKM